MKKENQHPGLFNKIFNGYIAEGSDLYFQGLIVPEIYEDFIVTSITNIINLVRPTEIKFSSIQIIGSELILDIKFNDISNKNKYILNAIISHIKNEFKKMENIKYASTHPDDNRSPTLFAL